MPEDPIEAAMRASAAKRAAKLPPVALERTTLAPDAPAPATNELIATQGIGSVQTALSAWDARVRGLAIIDIAHEMGVTVEGAKLLIREAHQAIAEDLKDSLEINRQLDLARVDGLLQTYYPAAQEGSVKAALVTLKCLERRAKLTGVEPEKGAPSGASPHNVLIWIQQQMPSINRIVDALPVEEAPAAPVSQ